jgi:ribonuclease D
MTVITTTEELETVCRRFQDEPYVTVDTEFMREKTYWPQLCLIQMASDTDEVLVDPLAEGIDLKPFLDVMAHTQTLKVFHSARQDIEIVHHMAGVIPHPLFDTQVAAMVCGFGDSVGYEGLIKKLVGARIDKSSRFTDWSRRPLSDKQLNYALSDVTHLRHAYKKLKKHLDNTGREGWLAEEMAILESPETYCTVPNEAWKRLKFRPRSKRMHAVFIEVAAWREREAQARDVPRNRVLKDEALGEVATQMPKSADDLRPLRAVPRGFADSNLATGLLKAVRAGLEAPLDGLPEIEDRLLPMDAKSGAVVEILKVALKVASERHHVAMKLIATVGDLEAIALDDDADVRALGGWRRELFGKTAIDLKHGRACIAIEGGRVVVVPLEPEEADEAPARFAASGE